MDTCSATDWIYLALDPGEQHGGVASRDVDLLGLERVRLADCPEKPDDFVRARSAGALRDLLLRARPVGLPTPTHEGDVFRFALDTDA